MTDSPTLIRAPATLTLSDAQSAVNFPAPVGWRRPKAVKVSLWPEARTDARRAADSPQPLQRAA